MKLDVVYNENCLEGLKKLPDNSVDCCVTSPPYYGLRDYGTGKWIGGDPNCPHMRTNKLSDKCTTGHKNLKEMQGVGDSIYKSVCPVCGAVRVDEQIGLEESPQDYINKLVDVFMEVHRILKPDGTFWLNIGDTYNGYKAGNDNPKWTNTYTKSFVKRSAEGLKPKDLIGIPWMLAFALREKGWYLRQDIIWHKPNPMPEPVKDRCTKSHEYIFLFSKSQNYYYDYESIQERAVSADDLERRVNNGKAEWKTDKAKDTYAVSGEGRDRRELYSKKHKNLQYDGQKPNTMHLKRAEGMQDEEFYVRNKRDVWSVPTRPDKVSHFAVFPEELIKPCILAGCAGGV